MQGSNAVENPILITAAPGLVVVSLSDSVAAFYSIVQQSKPKSVQPPFLSWARPIVIVIVSLVVVWHFGNKRYV